MTDATPTVAASALVRLRSRIRRPLERLRAARTASMCAAVLTVAWIVIFGRLAVENQRNFGTWSYDMGIYDQGFWLVSQGGSSFMTVRGLDFWAHHVNPIAFVFAPFY